MKVVVAMVVALFGAAATAQEGSTALPANYRIQFENAWVKVTSVRYEPKQQLPGHAHTPNASAYVYLNDGPPVIFRHAGGKPATRAATKAGAFRVYKGLEEVHEVENTGAEASEFLRVELKTVPLESATFFGKFERPATASGDPVIHFNHPQLRVSRLWIQPNQELQVTATSDPVLVVALKDGAALKRGESRWVDASASARFRNSAATAVDLLRFDFRTRPRDTR